ncbi:hypothetical protein AcW1_007048 [Taiwanofungus camphoratus]|nr:hypothetical protein AcV7_005140 [Antrodia cinnamomea]KAI0955471.1 hypothetical protein AcW1_007048 [Antrodia cinnamomea]
MLGPAAPSTSPSLLPRADDTEVTENARSGMADGDTPSDDLSSCSPEVTAIPSELPQRDASKLGTSNSSQVERLQRRGSRKQTLPERNPPGGQKVHEENDSSPNSQLPQGEEQEQRRPSKNTGRHPRASAETRPGGETQQDKTKASAAWAKCAKRLWKEDEDMIMKLKQEIDRQLTFAGIFSAVLTAFNIELYTSLQPPVVDPSLAILLHISAQLSSFSVNNGGLINSTLPALSMTIAQPQVSSSAIRINAWWFSSLIMSLSATSIGISVQQWLSSYLSHGPTDYRTSARIRQHRSSGLAKWRVMEIANLLLVLLQVALILFLIGLLELLWPLDKVVASIATVLAGALVLFTICTSILPALAESCPYKSTQAWWVMVPLSSLKVAISFIAEKTCLKNAITTTISLAWTIYNHLKSVPFPDVPHPQPRWMTYRSWTEYEEALVRYNTELDRSIMLEIARMTVAEYTSLEEIVRPCLNSMQLSPALSCVKTLLEERQSSVWTGEKSDAVLLDIALDVLARTQLEEFKSVEKSIKSHQDSILLALWPLTTDIAVIPNLQGSYKTSHIVDVLSALLNSDQEYDFSSDSRWKASRLLWLCRDLFRDLTEKHARAVITYATAFKENEYPEEFLERVALALHFSAALCPPDYQHTRSELLAMLGHLQKGLDTLDNDSPSSFLWDPSVMSVLSSSLLHIAKERQDPRIVNAALVRGLEKWSTAGKSLVGGNWFPEEFSTIHQCLQELHALLDSSSQADPAPATSDGSVDGTVDGIGKNAGNYVAGCATSPIYSAIWCYRSGCSCHSTGSYLNFS